jgi:hypothetical protein
MNKSQMLEIAAKIKSTATTPAGVLRAVKKFVANKEAEAISNAEYRNQNRPTSAQEYNAPKNWLKSHCIDEIYDYHNRDFVRRGAFEILSRNYSKKYLTTTQMETAKKEGRKAARKILFSQEIRRQSAYAYQADEKIRTSNPELKRARRDAQFRAAYLKKLSAQVSALNKKPGSLDALIKTADSGRKNKFSEINSKRKCITGKTPNSKLTPLDGFGNAGIIQLDIKICRKLGINWPAAGKDFEIFPVFSGSEHIYSAPETEWKNGKPVGYTRAVNIWRVRAIAFNNTPTTVDYVIHNTRGTVGLPSGYTWRTDQNGPCAVDSRGNDYHPTASDFLARNPASLIVAAIAANAEIRAKNEATLAADLADAKGIFLCVADSLKSGNCLAGTENWAKNHGFKIDQHYTAKEILMEAVKNGSLHRARLAVATASRRHRHEMTQGFCNLADHRA